jgi:hypothetical protein
LRGLIAFGVAASAVLAVSLALCGPSVFRVAGYHGQRGLEIGSVYAGVLLLYGTLTGRAVPWEYNFEAYHIAPSWGNALAWLVNPSQAAAMLAVVVRTCRGRGGRGEGVRMGGAAVLAFLVTGKVLSPQFLIWLLPFVAALGGRSGGRARPIYLAACLMTSALYPWGALYGVLANEPAAVVLLNLRNLLLVGLFLLFLSRGEVRAVSARGLHT